MLWQPLTTNPRRATVPVRPSLRASASPKYPPLVVALAVAVAARLARCPADSPLPEPRWSALLPLPARAVSESVRPSTAQPEASCGSTLWTGDTPSLAWLRVGLATICARCSSSGPAPVTRGWPDRHCRPDRLQPLSAKGRSAPAWPLTVAAGTIPMVIMARWCGGDLLSSLSSPPVPMTPDSGVAEWNHAAAAANAEAGDVLDITVNSRAAAVHAGRWRPQLLHRQFLTDKAIECPPRASTACPSDGSLAGKVDTGDGNPRVIINVFVAHWCPHCQKEVPRSSSGSTTGTCRSGRRDRRQHRGAPSGATTRCRTESKEGDAQVVPRRRPVGGRAGLRPQRGFTS